MTFQLISNANVVAKKVIDPKGHAIAEITINDQFEHRFGRNSRISKHLDMMSADDLSERLSGGSYFIINGQLVDFRDGSYNGFVHSNDSIEAFMDTLGFQHQKDLPTHLRRRGRQAAQQDVESTDDKIILRKVWDKNQIIVPGYAQGAEFSSHLSFVWNPFVRTINSSFDLIRLICDNGAVGVTSFLNTKVPLFNRQTEHLDIAARQIQNKVNGIVTKRVQIMSDARASVGDLLLLEDHILDRLYTPNDKGDGERQRLLGMLAAVSARNHLDGVYREGVFADKNLAAQLPAHLSQFDAYNIATELRTHTNEGKTSTGGGLDKFANAILFDREDNHIASAAAATQAPALAVFSSPEQAFFGDMTATTVH